jgi:hypothetical protein
MNGIITQEEFERKIVEAQRLEPMRFQLYDMGLKLIQSEYDIEAYLLILATWNFARFRYFIRKFDLDRFRVVINTVEPIFQRLNDKNFMTADWDLLSNDIKEIYSQLKLIVEQTGASKLMHFKQPKLFVMWDTAIRTYYHIPQQSSADDYLNFLQLMKTTFGHLQWDREDRIFAKVIDEYNFVLVHNEEENAYPL